MPSLGLGTRYRPTPSVPLTAPTTYFVREVHIRLRRDEHLHAVGVAILRREPSGGTPLLGGQVAAVGVRKSEGAREGGGEGRPEDRGEREGRDREERGRRVKEEEEEAVAGSPTRRLVTRIDRAGGLQPSHQEEEGGLRCPIDGSCPSRPLRAPLTLFAWSTLAPLAASSATQSAWPIVAAPNNGVDPPW